MLSTADRWGNMVSWVNSNYSGFGSGLTVPGYGIILHDRGALFTLDGEGATSPCIGERLTVWPIELRGDEVFTA